MHKLLIILIVCSLVACSPRRPAKVDEVGNKPHRSQTKSNSRHPVRKTRKTTHKVVKGDSLYSIGFRYQKDYKTLAAINNIKPPYRIYPDQIIKLTGTAPNKVVFKPNQSNNKQTVSKGVQTKPMVSTQPVVAKKEPPQPNKTKNTPNTNTQATVAKPNNKPTTNSTANKPVKKPARKPVTVATPNNNNLKWLWPTKGKIRTTFLASNPARKGISIGGNEGQPVKAAEAGVVVYSGSGLLGYGELVIIKHNEQYLSAYGHNKSLKVKEGQAVNRGQVIAELGSSGTNVNNLHFEIRKNGKPVNPLNYVKP